jgi:MFS family permease
MRNSAKRWWVLTAVAMASILVSVDFTIVNTVLGDIQTSFGINLASLQWVMTGFGITFSAFLIGMGRLGDLLGRRLVLYLGMLGFVLASIGAGLAPNIHVLTICRVIQGMCGATVFPTGMAITAVAFNDKERGRALGLYGSILGIGLAMGPVIGGVITSLSSWRWVFLINVPYILVCFLLCFWVVDESRAEGEVGIDGWGMALVTLMLGAFVFAITQVQTYGLASPFILSCFVLAVILGVGLWQVEKRVAVPFIPMDLFVNKYFLLSVIVFCCGVGLVWTNLFFIPLYLQTVLQLNQLETGLFLLPMTAMTVIAPSIAGILYDRDGPLVTTLVAFAMLLVGLGLLYFVGTQLAIFYLIFAFVCVGLGWGIANGIGMPIVLSSPNNKQNEGLISGAVITVLNIFGVVILAFASTLFHYIDNLQLHKEVGAKLAFVTGFHGIMLLLFGMTLLGLIIVFYIFSLADE